MPTIFRDPVTINGLEFNTRVPVDGALLFCDFMEGWDDSPEPRVEVSEFGYSDGVVAADRFPYKEKYIEFGGYVLSNGRLAADKAKDLINKYIHPNVLMRLVRQGPIAKAMDVKLSSKIEITSDIGDQGFRWVCRLMAPWPYKFSPTEQVLSAGVFSGGDFYREYDDATSGRVYDDATSGRVYVIDVEGGAGVADLVSMVNEGNADAYPTIIIRGPLLRNTWQLVNETTGEVQWFEIDLSSGVELTINNLQQTATIGEQSVDYYLRGDWIRLIPGVNTLRLSTAEDNPDAGITVRGAHTWRN